MGGSSPGDPRRAVSNRQRLPARRPAPPDPDDHDDDDMGTSSTSSASSAPRFEWDPSDALASHAVLLGVLALGSTPWLQDQRYGYVPYFAALALCSVYVGAHRGVAREDRENLTLAQTAVAPVALSASLLLVYLLLRYTSVDFGALVGAYFWLLGALATASAYSVPIGAALGARARDEVAFVVPVPEGLALDRDTGEFAKDFPVSYAAAVAALVGFVAATADVAAHHENHTLNNFLATAIVADFLSLVGVGSFAAAAALGVGLLAYDAFWVFGSGAVFGDGTVDSNVMMAVATSDSFRGPFRLLFPRYDDVLDPIAPGVIPYSLLGLGDVAVPGLLACVALRYDASRATDMGGRARAAAAAFMNAFDDAWTRADAESPTGVADRLDESVAADAADAADAAFDAAAEALGEGTGSGSASGSGSGSASEHGLAGATRETMTVPHSMGGRAIFSSVMRAYAVGLATACWVNAATGVGQPALVYLVPATLGGAMWTARERDELPRLLAFRDETQTTRREDEEVV